MKRFVSTLLLASVMALPLMAQYPRHPRMYRPAPSRSVPGRPVYGGHRSHFLRTGHPEAYFGARLGVNAATLSSNDRYLDGGSARAGLNIGAVAGFQVAPVTPIFLETGLYYSEKGGKGSYDGRKFTYSLNYLEVPLLIKYRFDVSPVFSVQPFAGAFASVGVSGKMKDFGSRHAYSAYDGEGFRRLDAGLCLGCGVQFGPLYSELGYDIGLANVSHDYFDAAHTGCFFATCGLNF